MLDESDALGNADLLLLCQLSGQSGLAGCRVIDRHMDLLLKIDRGEMTSKIKKVKQLSLACNIKKIVCRCLQRNTHNLLWLYGSMGQLRYSIHRFGNL